MTLTLFSIILSIIATLTAPPYSQVKQQAENYIQNIEDGRSVDESFWALNELYTSNCSINTIVEHSIKMLGSEELNQLFNNYSCSNAEAKIDDLSLQRLEAYALKSGSLKMAVAVLTNSESKQQKERFLDEFVQVQADTSGFYFLEHLVNENQISISTSFLEDSFVLYQILYSNYVNSTFSKEDFIDLIKSIKSELEPNRFSFKNSFVHYNLFKTVYEVNHFNEIKSLFDYLLADQFYPKSKRQVSILSGVDYGLSIMGNYSESLQLQNEKLLPFAGYYQLKVNSDYTLLQRGVNLYDLGKYKSSQVILEELYNDQNSFIPKPQLFTNLSLTYQKLGEQNKYSQFLLEAVKALDELDSEQDEYFVLKLKLYKNLFVYYSSIGDDESALNYIELAKLIALRQNNNQELGSIYYYLGDYYWRSQKNAEKALLELNKAQDIFDEEENYRRQMFLLFDKTSILIEIDSLEEATSLNIKTRELAITNADTPKLVRALIHQGEIALKKNDLISAEKTLNQIKLYPLTNLEFEVLIRYHNLFVSYLQRNSLYREAVVYFTPVLTQVIDRAKGSVNEQSGFWTVEDEYLDAFENMVTILGTLGEHQKSLAYLDQLKTINDASLYNNPLIKANKLNEKELADDKKLSAQILQLRNKYLGAREESKASIKAEIDRLSAVRQALTNKVSLNIGLNDLPIWKVQQQIKNDELVIHFTQMNDKLYVYRITNTKIEPSILPLNEKINAFLESTANNLALGKTSLLQLSQLYEFLNLNSIPKHIKQISVIPDGDLYRIPLEVLPKSKPNTDFSFGSTRFMIEDYSFKYFTSLQDYSENNRLVTNNLPNDFSVFAISHFDGFNQKDLPSLPYATKEATIINQKLTSFRNKSIYSGDSATTNAFKEQLTTSRIIHVATHSEVSMQDPLFSTIYLNSSETESQFGEAFYAYQLFDNKLDNELIMLNSCSSGSGNYMQGSGIMGISRALRYAGAKSLALNLWEVNDKIASNFAESFYTYINKGYSKSEAMRQAKIAQIKTGSADPHYWGAYTLIGNSSPIIKKPVSSLFVMPFLLAISLLAGYRMRKKEVLY